MPPKAGAPRVKGSSDQSISPNNLKNNLGVLSFFRTYVSIVAGIVVGLLGVEGWHGFIPHFASQLLCAAAMLCKGAASPTKYFHSWSNLLFLNVFSSTTLLTYILMWMCAYNIAHVF